MKENIMENLLIGFMFLIIWLNWRQGYIKDIIAHTEKNENLKLSIISLSLISLPLGINYLHDLDHLVYLLPPATLISLIVKESVDLFKEKNKEYEIKSAIWGELYSNYDSLVSFVKTYRILKSMTEKEFNSKFYKSIASKWSNDVYKSNKYKIFSWNLYNIDVINDIKEIHERMEVTISGSSVLFMLNY
ncbi:hypothetical protein H6G54_17245 [Anabaena cylindrica FACHB-243]|uniref:Uncharacterized protein n=1 Tax=Anabaena cylindrica (strain ATCC 27899 / PCC 7122) TaxID=272123 RepID=K9ZG06_ANACC|nr:MULTISPECIES: hypothetical protein [Anabaena]AFZ57674.1 hypothetical protein Anacy_2213 [Anabaena cylindrica PCC 7122]MBD2419413.1 hypothetical protein [Anabaena cylindrica FACHB-243]MBY5280583.1 hypothetical protein [Anabaena sp. CCAP 1446/1C]MCM2407552.1 hypothetical protein [Anabaena sp. CCAP 1446/1C]BAY05369.1 hypothetical protein NIES19_46400 [Anabaena cylindrica PCC 7122]